MSGASKALPQVSYNSFHAFVSSVGLVLIAFALGATFSYMIGLISFVNVPNGIAGLFLAVIFVVGCIVLTYGVCSWKKRADNQAEYERERTREQKALADNAEQKAERDTAETEMRYNNVINSVGEAETSDVSQEPDIDSNSYEEFRSQSSAKDELINSNTNQPSDKNE